MYNGLPNPLQKPIPTEHTFQDFHDDWDEYEVRVFPGTQLTQGRPFVIWDDIRDVFPDAIRLQRGKRAIGFMADADGNRLQPLRIEYLPHVSIQVVTSAGSTKARAPSITTTESRPPSSDQDYFQRRRQSFRYSQLDSKADVHGQLSFATMEARDSLKDRALAPGQSTLQTPESPLDAHMHVEPYSMSSVGASFPPAVLPNRDSVLSEESLSDESKNLYRNALQLFEEFTACLQSGQIVQANAIRNVFLEKFSTLESDLTTNQELLQHLMEMRQIMSDMHQQALQRLVTVNTRIRTTLAKNYGPYEAPVPRLFVVLPEDSTHWDATNVFNNRLRLHFLCECGKHTKRDNHKKTQHHIHLSKHEGYALEDPAGFFEHYGPYVLILLQMLKYGAEVDGLVVQALQSPDPGQSESTDTSSISDCNIEPGVNQAIMYLTEMSTRDSRMLSRSISRSQRRQKEAQTTLSGSDLRRVTTFLKIKDTSHVLGDLYRVITDGGHVKWVCLDHYCETHDAADIKALLDTISSNSGTFNRHNGRVEISLPSSFAASAIYRVLERSKFVQELKVSLKWEISVSDLKALRDMIQKSSISALDLTCSTASKNRPEILGRGKRSNSLWEIMMDPRIHSFRLMGYTGFFSRTTTIPRTTNLCVLKLTERLDWKKEESKIEALLQNCPKLHVLHLNCTDADAAYTTIKGINYDLCTLEYLTIDGSNTGRTRGDTNALQARFQGGIPLGMDLIVTSLSSPLLKEARILFTLHIRLGLEVKEEIEPSMLVGVLSRNPTLTKLMLQCDATEFLRYHIAMKNALADDEASMLHTLRLYGGRNQLIVKDIQGDTTVELELMSINMPRNVIEVLLRVYGTQLTKASMEVDVVRSLSDIVQDGGVLVLQHVEIVASRLMPDMLSGLRLIFENTESTLTEVTVLLDKAWEATSMDKHNGTGVSCSLLADFIVEFSSRWTQISVSEEIAKEWLSGLQQRGLSARKGVLNIVPRSSFKFSKPVILERMSSY
ncbi:hypothetical protein BGZ98_000240 [Dissophora globulifera]|nr:hypothetical protein BGZ98_000240 [Dissophora globulifera]